MKERGSDMKNKPVRGIVPISRNAKAQANPLFCHNPEQYEYPKGEYPCQNQES